MQFVQLFSALIIFISTSSANAFDHSHYEFDVLLKNHVTWDADGDTSTVNYFGFEQNKVSIEKYLQTIGSVSRSQFESFEKKQQLAFLINAYNAYTVFWVSQHHRDIKSIKELGTLFRSP